MAAYFPFPNPPHHNALTSLLQTGIPESFCANKVLKGKKFYFHFHKIKIAAVTYVFISVAKFEILLWSALTMSEGDQVIVSFERTRNC